MLISSDEEVLASSSGRDSCWVLQEATHHRVIEAQGRKWIATYHPAVRFYREDLAKKLGSDFALFKKEAVKIR